MAQPGRALGSGPRGRRFKSYRPDYNLQSTYASEPLQDPIAGSHSSCKCRLPPAAALSSIPGLMPCRSIQNLQSVPIPARIDAFLCGSRAIAIPRAQLGTHSPIVRSANCRVSSACARAVAVTRIPLGHVPTRGHCHTMLTRCGTSLALETLQDDGRPARESAPAARAGNGPRSNSRRRLSLPGVR